MMLAGPASAGEVIFLNGDRLTGTVVRVLDGELTLETEGAGTVVIKLEKVKTFSTDEPVRIRIGEKPPFESIVAPGPEGRIAARSTPSASAQPVPIHEITSIKPHLPWRGEALMNGLLTRGSSRRLNLGPEFQLKRDWERVRLSFAGKYFYGRERSLETGIVSTTDDFGAGYVKFERDATGKLYTEAKLDVLHDGLADLSYRLTPTAGLGYRWSERPNFRFYTETGIAYEYERYETAGSRDFWGPSLAYGLEWNLAEPVKLLNTARYLPSFSNWTGDYVVDAAGSVRFSIWRGMFMECGAEYYYDNTPAPGAPKGYFRLIIGPGWSF
jgi:hypothetical protein